MWRAISFTLLKRAAGSKLRPDQFSRCVAVGRTPSLSHYVSTTVNVGRTPSLSRYVSTTVNVGRSENGGGDANTMSCEEAKRLMRLVNVEAVKEKLGREDKEVITYDELIGTCRKMGVAKSGEEAAAFVRVMDDAGIILLFRDKVYLHPNKVVDLVRKAVPLSLMPEDDPTKEELKNLQEKKEIIDMLAHKQVRRILWGGLGLAVLQVGFFFRLTFWEFSWDVMEPIAFFTTSAGIVVGYAYFMFTSRDPTYQDLLKRLFLSRQRKLIKRHDFDVQRFVELQKQYKLPPYSCASIKRRIGVEVEPDDLLHGH